MSSADNEELFGSPAKVAFVKRSRDLWSLLRDNPRFAYYGRAVGLSDPRSDTADVLCSLARLQGATVCFYYPASEASALFAELEFKGMVTHRHEQLHGGEDTLAASRKTLETFALPKDLTVMALDQNTPAKLVFEVAELCQSCDVMPVSGSIMRGVTKEGICLVAVNKRGQPAATASSYIIHHPESARTREVFWGMLATRPERRGEKIALLLGAQAIRHMWEKHGARGVMTGVRADNESSQALCKKLGFDSTQWICASCIDPGVLGETSVTK